MLVKLPTTNFKFLLFNFIRTFRVNNKKLRLFYWNIYFSIVIAFKSGNYNKNKTSEKFNFSIVWYKVIKLLKNISKGKIILRQSKIAFL